jgi:uncharacterized coiled-coil protein SlyX
MLKWSGESLTAAAAICITTAGGVITTAVNWGTTHARISAVEEHQKAQDTRTDGLSKDVTDTRINAAQANQKLDDVKQQLDRIEKKL